MELELNNEVEKSAISNDSAISEFTKELSKTLEIEDLFSYRRPIDNGEFTDENLVKLEEEYKKIIKEFLNIKEFDEFLIDKEMTQEMYYKMKEYETKLLNEQEKYLKKIRKDGELYYVKKIERRLQILENRTKL